MRSKRLFNIICLFYFFISSNVWFAFVLPTRYIVPLISLLLLAILASDKVRVRSQNQLTTLLGLLTLIFIWSWLTVNFGFSIGNLFYYLPAILLVLLPYKEKKSTLYFITKWFGIIMSISLVIFVLAQLHVLPCFGVFKVPENTFYRPYNNYIFFIQSTSILSKIIYRFNGPFLEPGHLSMVCSLILFANKYDFKSNRWLWVSLVCVIISLSLAGYVISMIGFILLKMRKASHFLLTFTIFLCSYLFVTQIWNGGDNILNVLIVSRLEYDEEKGIAGNNRTFGHTDEYFESNWKKGALWTGLGVTGEHYGIEGAGYKIYFLRYGIISALLILILYLNLSMKDSDPKYTYSFIIILVLLFLQRAYPWWFSWLLCFTLGTGCNLRRRSKGIIETNHTAYKSI